MRSYSWSSWCTTAFACVALLALCSIASTSPAVAQSGPFAEFDGRWSGTGTLRPQNGRAERIRCQASYRLRGSSGHQIDLRLSCDSDSYKFDLSGDFTADAKNQITGRWTEHTRNIGGTVIGSASGDRMQLHIESSAFAATLNMVTRSGRQSVTLDSRGGGEVVKGSISLRRR